MSQKETNFGLKNWFAPIASPRLGGASLDILRFVASLFILFFHYYLNAPTPIDIINPIMTKGWIGTDFFIMLSGLVLARAYGLGLSNGSFAPKDFIIRRYARLMPSHLIILYGFAVLIIFSMVLGYSPNYVEAFSKQGFALQALLMNGWGIMDQPSWNYPTWTISALIICYFLYSVTVKYIYNLPKRDLAILFIAIIVISNQLSTNIIGQNFVSLSLQWALLRAIPLFYMGVIIERLFANINISKYEFIGASVSIFAIIIIASYAPKNILIENLIIIALALLVGTCSRVKINENKASQRMGRISYSLYLIHVPFQIFYFRLSDILVSKFQLNNHIEWLLWFGAVIIAVFVAYIFELFIDYPISKFISIKLKEKQNKQIDKGAIFWRKLHI